MKKLTALVATLVALAGHGRLASATTFYPGIDNAVTDSSMKTVNLAFARPAFGDSVIEPMTGAELKRVTGVTGQVIPGTGGTPAATWNARSRHHYSKDQPWSADEKYFWIQQKGGNPTKLILDSLGVAKWVNTSTMTPYCACLDSVEELRMHPTFPNTVVGFISKKGSVVYNKLIWFTLDSCLVKRSWVIPLGYPTTARNDSAFIGLKGEGTPSDNGRFVSIGTHYNRETAELAAANILKSDSIVVVDMMYPEDRVGDPLAPDTLGGRIGAPYQIPTLPFAADGNNNGTLGHQSVSTRGTYVNAVWEAKNANSPAYSRVFHRGTSAGADTSVLTLWPHTMAALGLRMGAAKDSTLGWIASMSHGDMNETTAGVEVVVGGMRIANSQVSVPWCEASITGAPCSPRADRDSGSVIMVELATGLHRHVSGGQRYTGFLEHGDNHGSGRATGMRGWHLVTHASMVEGTPQQFADEMVFWKLDGDFTTGLPTHSAIRVGTTHTNDATGSGLDKYDREGHGVPSPTGRRVMFNSTWSTACVSCGDNTDVKSYVYDIRTDGQRDFYVKQGALADTTKPGFSALHPSTSFAKFNRLGSAANGQNIVAHVLASGVPIADFPNPIHAPLGGKRYYVYGSIANPAAATIAGNGAATLSQSDVSVRGVKIAGDLKLISPAKFDSITHFQLSDRLSLLGADRSVIADGTVSGTSLALGAYDATIADARSTRDTVLRVNFTGLTAAGGQHPIRLGSSSPARWVDSLYYANNQHAVNNTGTVASWANDHVMRSAFVGNKFAIKSTSTAPDDPSVFFRDSCAANLFRRDTVHAFGAGTQAIALAYDGGRPGTSVAGGFSTVDSCYFLARNGSAISFPAHHVRGWTIKRTTAVSSGAQAMRAGNSAVGTAGVGFLGKNYIDHNTLVSDHRATGSGALREMGVAGFDGAKTVTDSVRFTNNLIYSLRAGVVTTDSVAGVGWNLVDADTTAGNESKMRQFVISNWNAYAVYPHALAPGDKAISYVRTGGLNYAKPGASTAWNTLFPGRDVASVYGSPAFDRGGPDSTFGLSTTGSGTAFDPAISELSIAAAKDSSGGDIGAVAAPAASRAVLSAYDIFTPIPAAGASDTLSVYISNTGNATLTLGVIGVSDPDGAPPGAVVPTLTATLSSSSVAVGAASRLLIIVGGLTGAVPYRYDISIGTNEPITTTRTVSVHIGRRGSGGIREITDFEP